MLKFDFLEKGLEIISPPHILYDFSGNVSHVLFYKMTTFHCLAVFYF